MYSAEAIKHLTKLIQGNDSAREWLQKHNLPELILLHFALARNEKAFHELKNKKHAELTAFSLAVIEDDKRAYNWLAENKHFTWAATARVTFKDMNAEAWLMRNHLSHYAELARAIRRNDENEQADDIVGLFRKFLGIFKSKKTDT